MRKQLSHAALVLMVAAGLAACTPGGGPAPTTSAPPGTESPSATGTPSADAETKTPAPSPSAAPVTSGPGQGNAELAISVKPSETGTPENFTLVCVDGAPADESQHPDAAAACLALKNNAAILSPAPRPTDQACTMQYGGPQQATVTGVVDGQPVETNFSLTDGCEIALWNAAKDVLGSTGGAV
ncbi:SSI family serine proteinase inhibitor [Arthrobacter sp. EPSL27]|uniref:SSI family serine proteinase inhibitor n=1 Tax=Arthrobacter sp. EPSL27 TaxID=1745378 RepID=UPI00074B04EE|nr:SSI family serine proteinase inhibitor [Arthrobacter sp. EPSL27]KUM36756.1 serine protease inhibitor [Arthrobacter sp. EPSL27]